MRLLIFFLLFINILAYGQPKKDETFYFNEYWQKTNKAEAIYYRVVGDFQPEIRAYFCTDYFISGEKYSEGTYDWPETSFEHGTILYYYKSGSFKKEMNFSKSKPFGEYKEWYPNGKLKLNGEYIPNIKNPKEQNILKIHSFWNSEGKQLTVKGNGKYSEFNENKKVFQSGLLKGGFKDGNWKGVDSLNHLVFNDIYRNGKFIKGTSKDADSTFYKYSELSTKPIVKGGVDNYHVYIDKKIDLLKRKKSSNFTGRLYIQFNTLPKGGLDEFKIISVKDFKLQEDLFQILRDGPTWKTATTRGKKINGKVIQPITFH